MSGRTTLRLLREYSIALVVALGLSFLIRSSVVEAYRIPSASMENTLLVGDRLFANKFIFGASIPLTHVKLPPLREPHVGDVVIFRSPEDPSVTFVKRVVALSGQTVEVHDKAVYVDGHRMQDAAGVKHEDARILPPIESVRDFLGPLKVPAGYLFVLGDNRDNSWDSRYWGFLDERLVIGKAEVIFWSWNDAAPAPLLHRIRWSRIGHRLG